MTSNRENSRFFEIYENSLKDLNDYKETLEVADAQDEETLGCCCCTEGPISINVNMAKSGFVPGEKAVINVKLCRMKSRLAWPGLAWLGHEDVRNCPSNVILCVLSRSPTIPRS